MLIIFGFFHLNIAFSSIDEELHEDLINSCYSPLLEFIEKNEVPMGIELSAFTLERIHQINPKWIQKLMHLQNIGLVDLIGCGYAQIIGPLVPPRITQENLKIGNLIYDKYLSMTPTLALVNEQVFSKSLADLYIDSGYESIIMEWNNPYMHNPEWNREWKFNPQFVLTNDKKKITTIWNDTIAFQKFQRYVHGELSLNEYLIYVKSQITDKVRNFSIYGSDVEVFNFRPGRFSTETVLEENVEWDRISDLFKALKEIPKVSFIKPSQVSDFYESNESFQSLDLTTAEQPIVVKKQPKYNTSRWAVTGRNDININTRCWRLYESLNEIKGNDSYWKELCYLWSSDFRTHITEKRWDAYKKRLDDFESQIDGLKSKKIYKQKENVNSSKTLDSKLSQIKLKNESNYIHIKGNRTYLKLNIKKGLSIEKFLDNKVDNQPLFGTLKHGYFDDIAWGADFFSGHLVYEIPGEHKITDICNVEPKIEYFKNSVKLCCETKSSLGKLYKEIVVNDENGKVYIKYALPKINHSVGSLRYGFITLFTENFDKNSLNFMTHNGGDSLELFQISNKSFDHGEPVSKLISCKNIIGATGGIILIGDKNKKISIEFEKSKNASVGMIQYKIIGDKILLRANLSSKETDDTSKIGENNFFELNYCIGASK